MTISSVKRVLGTALCALLAAGVAQAEDAKWFVGGGLMVNLDSMKNMTNQTLGFNIQGGVDFKIQEGLTFRPGLQVSFFPGSEEAGTKVSLRSYQAYGDFVYPTGLVENLNLTFGISVNRYEQDYEGPSGSSDGYEHIFGTKLGARLGVEYRINKNFSAEMLLQMTELGLVDGQHRNPSWIQVGAKYHF